MLLRALGYLLLPFVVIGAVLVIGYLVPAWLFPHWSADAHATVAMAVAFAAALGLAWGATLWSQRRAQRAPRDER
jgi:hypothetical protein